MSAAPYHVMALIFGWWRSQILYAGMDLGVYVRPARHGAWMWISTVVVLVGGSSMPSWNARRSGPPTAGDKPRFLRRRTAAALRG